jgi:hypothetical protein
MKATEGAASRNMILLRHSYIRALSGTFVYSNKTFDKLSWNSRTAFREFLSGAGWERTAEKCINTNNDIKCVELAEARMEDAARYRNVA